MLFWMTPHIIYILYIALVLKRVGNVPDGYGCHVFEATAVADWLLSGRFVHGMGGSSNG